ncbi:hypothetical protein RDWZM_000240, partial [Blomia tropicalis]
MAHSIIICFDNSESARNGDFLPNRLVTMRETVYEVAQAIVRHREDNEIGFITMGGSRPDLASPMSHNMITFQKKLHETRTTGNMVDLFASLKLALLIHNHRISMKIKLKRRVIVFLGSTINEIVQKDAQIDKIGEQYRQNEVSLDLIIFGDPIEVKCSLEYFELFVDSLGSESQLIGICSNNHDISTFIFDRLRSLSEFRQFRIFIPSMELPQTDDIDLELMTAIQLSLNDLQQHGSAKGAKTSDLSSLETTVKEKSKTIKSITKLNVKSPSIENLKSSLFKNVKDENEFLKVRKSLKEKILLDKAKVEERKLLQFKSIHSSTAWKEEKQQLIKSKILKQTNVTKEKYTENSENNIPKRRVKRTVVKNVNTTKNKDQAFVSQTRSQKSNYSIASSRTKRDVSPFSIEKSDIPKMEDFYKLLKKIQSLKRPRTPRMSSSLEMKKKSITNIRLPKSRKTSVIFQNSALHSEKNVIKKSVGKFDFDKMKKIIDEKLNQLQENSRNKIGILQPNKLETLKSSPIHHTNLLPTIHQTKKKFEPIKIPILGKPFKLLNLNHNSKNSKLTEKKYVKT